MRRTILKFISVSLITTISTLSLATDVLALPAKEKGHERQVHTLDVRQSAATTEGRAKPAAAGHFEFRTNADGKTVVLGAVRQGRESTWFEFDGQSLIIDGSFAIQQRIVSRDGDDLTVQVRAQSRTAISPYATLHYNKVTGAAENEGIDLVREVIAPSRGFALLNSAMPVLSAQMENVTDAQHHAVTENLACVRAVLTLVGATAALLACATIVACIGALIAYEIAVTLIYDNCPDLFGPCEGCEPPPICFECTAMMDPYCWDCFYGGWDTACWDCSDPTDPLGVGGIRN